jgi:hypothetical protein
MGRPPWEAPMSSGPVKGVKAKQYKDSKQKTLEKII